VDLGGKVAALDEGRGIGGQVAGQVGELTVDGQAELPDTAAWADWSAEGRVAGPDLALLGHLAGRGGWPTEAFELVFNLRREAAQLSVDTASLQLASGEVAELTGTIAHVDQLAGNDLRIQARGPELARFRQLLRLPGSLGGPFDVQGELKQSPEGDELLNLQAATAVGDFTLAGPLGPSPDFYGSRLDWTAAGRDLAALGRGLGFAGWPAGAYTARGSLDWTQPGLVLRNSTVRHGQDLLEADGLVGLQPPAQRLNLKISLAGKDAAVLRRLLAQPGLPPGPYSLRGGLRRDAAAGSPLHLDALQVGLAGARVQVDGRVAQRQARIDADLRLAASGPDLSAFSQLAGQPLPRTRFSIEGRVANRGDALQVSGPATVSLGGLKGQATATLGQPLGQAPISFDLSLQGPGLDAHLPRSALSPLLARHLDLRARGSWRPGRWLLDELRLQTDRETIQANGSLSPGSEATGFALDFKALTRDLAATGQLFGWSLPAAESLSVAGRLSGDTRALVLSGLSAELGDSDLAGDITLRPGPPAAVDATLTSQLLDLRPWFPTTARPPAAITGELIPAVAIPVDWLQRPASRLDLRAQTLKFGPDAYTDVRLVAKAGDGRLDADPVVLNSIRGRLSGRVSIGPGSSGPVVSLQGQGQDVLLGKLSGAAGNQNRFSATVDLRGQGRDTRALAATLNGSVRLVGRGGQMDNRLLKTMYSDFLSDLLETLNPLARRQPYTQVVCSAYLFRADNGVLHTDPALVMLDGRIAERGTHQQLMARGGWYAQMFEMQRDEVDSALMG